MPETTLTPLPNGPVLVKGRFQLLDADGNLFPVEQETIALCRCGASGNKPFCDGTHRTIGFTTGARPQSQTDEPSAA